MRNLLCRVQPVSSLKLSAGLFCSHLEPELGIMLGTWPVLGMYWLNEGMEGRLSFRLGEGGSPERAENTGPQVWK